MENSNLRQPGLDGNRGALEELRAIIDILCASEAELRARVRQLEEDAAVYREICVAALDALRQLTVQHDRLRAEYQRLRDEYRDLREQVMLEAGADDSTDSAVA
jgi:uncharacterized coiled-coil DUF342 family protein